MKNIVIKASNEKINIDLSVCEISISLDAPNHEKELIQQPSSLKWSVTLLDGKQVSYAKAEEEIAKLGDGWRMPTRTELESLLDLTRHDPAVDTDKHPSIKSAYYWTSTPCAWNSAAVWVVYFNLGLVGYLSRHDDACVLAVRSSQ